LIYKGRKCTKTS